MFCRYSEKYYICGVIKKQTITTIKNNDYESSKLHEAA